jgi:hypothetical protein
MRTIILVALVVSTLGMVTGAQVLRRQPVNPPVVLSGSDVGFQITAYDGPTPVGRLVVRVDGRWMPVKEEAASSRLTQQ